MQNIDLTKSSITLSHFNDKYIQATISTPLLTVDVMFAKDALNDEFLNYQVFCETIYDSLFISYKDESCFDNDKEPGKMYYYDFGRYLYDMLIKQIEQFK